LREIEERFVVLPISGRACVRALALPDTYPKDPADRIIGATAIVEGMSLLTADRETRRSRALRTTEKALGGVLAPLALVLDECNQSMRRSVDPSGPGHTSPDKIYGGGMSARTSFEALLSLPFAFTALVTQK
jgi:hypothetical protein